MLSKVLGKLLDVITAATVFLRIRSVSDSSSDFENLKMFSVEHFYYKNSKSKMI